MKIEEMLRKNGEKLEMPKSLEPKQMKKTLEEYDKKQYFRRGKLYPALATAACFCILGIGLLKMHQQDLLLANPEQPMQIQDLSEEQKNVEEEQEPDESDAALAQVEELDLPQLTYEEIYEKMSANWITYEMEESVRGEAPAADGVVEEFAAMESVAVENASMDSAMQKLSDTADEVFGKTNVQVETVDEADRIKNDGRYLYQIARTDSVYGIQIVDTKDGLKETAFVTGFESIEEFYVWEDLLITIENKIYETTGVTPVAESERMAACYDMLYHPNQYHEITIFDIADREKPQEVKTFTLQGNYESSRISDGYFYGISHFVASAGDGKEDYTAYIPSVDGKILPTDRIYCPEYENGSQYLVIVSVDLKEPTKLKDSKAILSDGGHYYMSRHNLFLTSYESVWEKPPQTEGVFADKTKILRLAYLNGQFFTQAEGELPGNLESSFSLDEYNGNLRAVSTVLEHKTQKIVDERTGEVLGYDIFPPIQTNALYVLDRDLTVVGKLEGLAKDEEIYSARFFGDTGYFVTFRQTDPLFAVDLSQPENPNVLGELKVSGFSEYLHFWGDDLLLGLGMEADEKSGRTKGLKLSMFDISDPTNLSETCRKELDNYNYSDALYNHKAILIDVGENLIGFCAEGSESGEYHRDYVLYSYENGEFIQTTKFKTKAEDGGYYTTRGTFIGNTFYLLSENGTVKAYERTTGNLLEEL